MACESLALISNKSLEGKINNKLIFRDQDFKDLADKLKNILTLPAIDKEELGKELRNYILKEHGLDLLVKKIFR